MFGCSYNPAGPKFSTGTKSIRSRLQRRQSRTQWRQSDRKENAQKVLACLSFSLHVSAKKNAGEGKEDKQLR